MLDFNVVPLGEGVGETGIRVEKRNLLLDAQERWHQNASRSCPHAVPDSGDNISGGSVWSGV